MIFKLIPKIYPEDQQVYARIDDDGLCRLTCTEEYPEFKKFLDEGGVPLPADEVTE